MSIAMEEYEFMKDSKYRMYVAAVDKALKNFEYTSEWADLISALGKLNKVLLSYTKFPVIPRRIKISKRLAQCMHPALPSGVHLKALETYDVIFKCMGTNRLSHELFIYSAGLFPLLGHAAMNVRPSLLTVYETHFVPLGERLRPALSGFLSGVLPGLESGSDHFDRTNSLLEKVCDGVGAAWFYTCVWQCVRSNSPVRLPAISFVLAHCNRKISMENQEYLMGNDIDVMVSGLCAAVQDSSVLVQRSALELLMVGFPMHTTQLLYADMVRLVTSALVTILRRDMSLNRRLYSWLLGSEVNVSLLNSEHPLVKKTIELSDLKSHADAYFELYSFDILSEAIRVILTQSSSEIPVDVKPYRLLTTLFDKPQIGPVILDNILYDIFRALYLSCLNQESYVNTASNTARCVSFNGDLQSLKDSNNVLNKQFLTRNCQELTKNANLLFNTLETYYVWTYLGKLYESSANVLRDLQDSCNRNSPRIRCQVNDIGSGKPELLEICILTDFLLDVIPIETYADNTSEILPNLFINITTTMRNHVDVLNKQEISQSLQLLTKILTKIQPITIKQASAEVDMSGGGSLNISIDGQNVGAGEQSSKNFESNSASSGALCQSVAAGAETDKDELKPGLEKSKSDSKINENVKKSELTIDSSRERSNSNQMLKKLQKSSPKIDKKTKNKKSKSSSKLYDLKRDEQLEAASAIIESARIPIDIKDDFAEIAANAASPPPAGVPPPVVNSTTRVENKYIYKCLEVFKRFYIDFVMTKIIPDVNTVNAFDKLIHNTDDRTQNLEKILHECLDPERSAFRPVVAATAAAASRFRATTPQCDAEKATGALSSNSKCVDYENAMNLASNILLEFSAFPNLLSEDSEEKEVPFWLKVLIVICCYLPKSAKEIQLIAMNALMDIFSLSKSQFVNKDTEDANAILMGILHNSHVHFIADSTFALEMIAQILWDLLGTVANQSQIILCTSLLYQIHNVFDKKNFVEQVIGRYLIHDTLNVEFFKRFNLLWHLGRDLDVKVAANKNNMRSFDRSLLKILDNLRNTEKSNLKLLSENFLVHSLLRNDISRIMNPIFSILLSSNTARISITHINLHNADSRNEHNSDNVQKIEDAKLKKIYAISSVNGNVMYHVTDGANAKPTKLKNFLFNKTSKKSSGAINMTTSITENSNVITKKNRDFKNVEVSPNVDRSTKNNVKLFINPLSSKEIYPNGISGSYVKLDANYSEKSSSESLSSSLDVTQTSMDSPDAKTLESLNEMTKLSGNFNVMLDRDSGFESANGSKSLTEIKTARSSIDRELEYASKLKISDYLEQIETIADGISDQNNDYSGGATSQGGKLPKSQSLEDSTLNGGKMAAIDNLSLIHSWSYSISDSEKLDAELELSTPAEDFFQGHDQAIVHEILSDILDAICKKSTSTSEHSMTESTVKINELNLKAKITEKAVNVYPMHCHICLYCDVFDSELIVYSLGTLKNCILTNPQLFIKCLATTGLQNVKNNDVLNLFARHRKSIFGLGFSGDLHSEYVNFYRGFMFLEAVISVCLNYSRSFYPNLDNQKLSEHEIENNLKIQLASLEILEIIVKNLIIIVNENSKGFSSYIADMLVKCKLQKILLHCLLTSVRNFDDDMTFAEEILLFNHFQLYVGHNRVCEHVEAFQIQLLRLIQSLIVLEYQVFPNSENSGNVQPVNSPKIREHLTYTPTILIPQQQMFLSAIMSALRHQNMKSLHQNWCNMVTSCLPYFGANLKQISLSVIHQICNNIEKIADSYKNTDLHGELMTDYATMQLEALTVICHYCLLDSSQSINQMNLPSSSVSNSLTNPGEIFNNFLNVFLPPVISNDSCMNAKPNSDTYQNARKTILCHMPRIISSVAKLWQMISSIDGDFNGVYGSSKIVKQQLLEFLSPISIHHGASFLAAIAVAWHERRNPFSSIKTVLPEPNLNQNNLVCLISAIRVIPIDNLVQTVTLVIKNPPSIEGLSADICLDVSVLELFYCYMHNASTIQLQEAWSSLLSLVREGCSLAPPAQFLLAALLHELILKCCPLEERKDQKDLQDVTAKLIECVSQVCGSCLEQTTWLRRNLAVKEQQEDDNISTTTISNGSTNDINGNYNVQAQLVLAEILAPIVDICFGSSEKDKVNTVLTSLMYNIVPYLRTHTIRNMPSYLACSKLLASLSSYQYTRKAWRKDVFDLLLDNSFFQMDYSCLKYWKVIIDNLMTHDNTTFRDLMSRVSMTQSGSLNLFSSREQEYEQKAQLLKRLAFVILCSETDQYSKYMPDIQEQLANSLRLCVPGVQAQVFLCFRVLLIRMSPIHVTSLWPIIINEMLQVFLQIEQELQTDTEEFSSHIRLLTALDSSWATNSSNGLHALGHPHWLRLQLATAQLLDLALLLPATSLPQFQMYRWAFVGDDLVHIPNPEIHTFIPHVTRIAKLMDQKHTDSQIETLPTKQNELLLSSYNVTQLKDLHGFFKTLSLCSNRHRTECSGSVPSDSVHHDRQADKKITIILEKLDKVVESDFLDKIPR